MNRLQLGLVLDSTDVPAWQYELIERLSESEDASLSLIMLNDGPKGVSDRIGRSKPFLWFDRFERRRASLLHDACAIRSAANLIEGVEQVRLKEETVPHVRSGPPPTLHRAATRLDVLLVLGERSSIDELGLFPKHGVWFFSHDHGQTAGGHRPSAGFLETIKRHPFIRSALIVRRGDGPDDRIAYESWSGLNHRSYRKGQNAHLWKILHFVPRTLRQLNRLDGDEFFERLPRTLSNDPHQKDHRDSQLRSRHLWWALFCYLLWRALLKLQRSVYRERWVLMSSSGGSADLGSLQVILPPPDRFWADPHIFSRGGHTCVFFEDASMASGRGRISAMCIGTNGKFSQARPIIERPYHLSYPFVFAWNGEILLIPESAEKGAVEVFRCKKFPYEWEYLHDILTDVSAYDATLFENDGIWWMFANIPAHEGASSCDELHLFYADSPISKHWHAHEMNPIVSDVRRARPAGRIYRANGRIYRPSQNSSYRYGYGLQINEIVVLTTTDYQERVVKALEPVRRSPIRAVHSFSRDDELVMLDGIYRSPVWSYSPKPVFLGLVERHGSPSTAAETRVRGL